MSLLNAEIHDQRLRDRLPVILVFSLCIFFLIWARLWYLQVLRGDKNFERSRRNIVATRSLPSSRGKVFDRKLRVLATNRESFNIYVRPKFATEEIVSRLFERFGIERELKNKMIERFRVAKDKAPRQTLLLLRDQKEERIFLLRQEKDAFPGIEVHVESARLYPLGNVAAHALGYLNQINAKEYSRYRKWGYENSDRVGRYGLEKKFESYLRGRPGIESYLINSKGHRVSNPHPFVKNWLSEEKAVAGFDVVLHLDTDVQNAAESGLRQNAAGAAVMVDVKTGGILAMASIPVFDPNTISRSQSQAQVDFLYKDPRKPLIDKSMRQHYPPGSIFKIFSAIAAKRADKVPENVFCGGHIVYGKRKFHCTHRHGNVDFTRSIKVSCNIYYWKVAQNIGLDAISDVAKEFGYGTRTGLGINGEVPGLVPTVDYYNKERHGYRGGYALNASIGQGDVTTTVLQNALAYAAFANGGTLYLPQLAQKMIPIASGAKEIELSPTVRNRIDLPEEQVREIHDGLFGVVNERGGTAFRHVRHPDYLISGKTGTAQVRALPRKGSVQIEGYHPEQDHAWFAGFYPSNEPRVAFAVIVEHAGGGGSNAGPIAKKMVEAYAKGEGL